MSNDVALAHAGFHGALYINNSCMIMYVLNIINHRRRTRSDISPGGEHGIIRGD